ncbi:helix-turn-helix domain-containing protein [Rhodococcus sp. BP-349]|uniref:helix-turn-helix domain-containing protein n=1 Tax=unclassified Rhodococcus (in: high G+C Gram-positive bacteria) TaxID=192944 RepID=UPI000486A056|nr:MULTISPECIES: helix-turn-helix domain-containing protein [unclassified Rhodococcus (in: high G+C Gram-positive bacteria)]KQU34789.1 MerR family transcriptional regulator [Rhodococcus sp. Leaf225]KQU45552.1 MerR family transcriptional regulator [Rhodococcus sp. Leaf258]MBY6540929.1 helix-turn-helix domain-containing protein [Rhodococcus sp. BP-363]MBY6545045.1 helix-turn-helix domain-containing protein [Rhodococcus sp. BP-369]MBY6564275.1 helix-turn-helix domain-containing protein [Rhodococc
MTVRMYSVDDVADMLGLHVRTVRGYVRSGRLPAVRIGKQYRISGEDLETFTGQAASTLRTEHRVEVTSIVDIDTVDRETADRLTALLARATGDARPDSEPLRVNTAYDAQRDRLKVVVLGAPREVSRLLDYLEGLLAA